MHAESLLAYVQGMMRTDGYFASSGDSAFQKDPFEAKHSR